MNKDEIIEGATPLVHLNGNSGSELLEEWLAFRQAIQDVRDAFPYQSFNGRNHYSKEGGLEPAEKAAGELRRRLAELEDIAHAVAIAIDDQPWAKKDKKF